MQYTRKRTAGQKIGDAFSSVISGKMTILSRLLIIVTVPVALLLVNNQMQDQSHATGTVNLLQNGSFENTGSTWLSPWFFNPKTGTAATISQDNTSTADGLYSAQINATTVTTNEWDIQLIQPISVTANQPYALSFSAKASVNRPMSMTIQQSSGAFTQYIATQTINLTTTPQTYTLTLTPNTTDPKAWIVFNFGQTTGQVWLDNIDLTVSTIASPTPTPIPSGSMPPPPGYSKLIFDDQFQGTTLDSTKWIPQMASEIGIWNNFGKLAYPLSAVGNADASHYDAEYDSPAALTINNGLTIRATRDTSQTGYTWQSGVICTHGKFYFQGGYLQVRARMPESSTSGWGAIWSLEGGAEIDTQESGFTALGTSIVNQVMASGLPGTGNAQQFYNAGVDLSAGYHIYGMKYVPGQSVTMYLDGKQTAQFTANIPSGAMSIIISLEIAKTNASGWHTVVSSLTPDPLAMNVSEVQVWTPGTPTSTSTVTATPTPSLTPTPIPTATNAPTFTPPLTPKKKHHP